MGSVHDSEKNDDNDNGTCLLAKALSAQRPSAPPPPSLDQVISGSGGTGVGRGVLHTNDDDTYMTP